MMNDNTKRLRDLIADGKLEACIDAMVDLIDTLENQALVQTIIAISARYNKYEDDTNAGTVSAASLRREFNSLTKAVLKTVNALPANAGHPVQVYDLPLPRNNHFQGRAVGLAEISNYLQENWVVVLTGIGSIGKTQLANEFAHRAKKEGRYDYIFWLSADTAAEHLSADEIQETNPSRPEALLQSAARIAQALNLEDKDISTKDTILKSLIAWLKVHRNWLVIIDNVRQWEAIEEFILLKDLGHILLTAQRSRNTGHIWPIHVGKMEKADGRELLLSRAHRLHQLSPEEEAAVEKIIAAIDGLPLALIHAAFYIDTRKCSFAEFLDLYASNQLHILKIPDGNLPGDYEGTILNTWSMAFNIVRESNAEAVELLEFFAFCHPDGLNEHILQRGGHLLGKAFDASPANLMYFTEVFRHIADFSLVQKDTSKRFIMHRLVQLIIRSNLSESRYQKWLNDLLNFYAELFPEPLLENIDWCETLIPHVLEFAQYFESQNTQAPDATFSRLFARAIKYLASRAQFEKALQLYAFAERQILNHKDEQASELLAIYSETASVFVTLGGQKEAAELLYKAQQLLSEEYPNITLELQINQGLVCKAQGAYELAEELLETAARQALQKKNMLLYAVAANQLGMLYFMRSQNETKQAQTLRRKASQCYKNAERTRRKLFPEDSTPMAELYNNLALLQSAQKGTAEAKRLFARAFDIYKKAYGAEHPDFGFCCYNRGLLHFHIGELEESKRYLMEALGIWERLSIPERLPSAKEERDLVVLKILDSLLAILLRDLDKPGQLQEASIYCKRILAIYEDRFDTEYLAMLNYLNVLGHVQRLAKEWHDAYRSYEEAILLLEDHPDLPTLDVARTYNNYAVLCQEMTDKERAFQYFVMAKEAWQKDEASQKANEEEYRNFLANAFGIFEEDPRHEELAAEIYGILSLLKKR